MQTNNPEFRFSERINLIPRSFIREILKVTSQPDVISFAGGLPNPNFFPTDALHQAATEVLANDGKNALQYSITQGYLPLREYLSDYYFRRGLSVSPEEILITNGSQQALDLLGKVFIDRGDKVLMERPSYLGAIQAFSAYRPEFLGVDLLEEGVDVNEVRKIVTTNDVKLFYTVPTFQNPSGITYSEEIRRSVGELFEESKTILVEDNPYEEIRFTDKINTPIKQYAKEYGILLGSFSKIISPGLRLGWVVANRAIISKFLVAKEAADLHSNQLSQRIIHRFLSDNDIQDHLKNIRQVYKEQKDCMILNIQKHFPAAIKVNNPMGGMFLWVKLPDGLNSRDILLKSNTAKVVFVPGDIFYVDKIEANSMRLNFSNSAPKEIKTGIEILGNIIRKIG